MKKLLLFVVGCCGLSAVAQDYVPFQITTGFNADVIANGVGPSLLSTTSSFDNANFVLISADFQVFDGDELPDYALPDNGIISYGAIPGLSYQLASYSTDNSLRLQEESDFGSLAIANGVPSTKLYVLTATGSGTGTLGGTIHFSDNTTQTITPGVIPDWFFSNALPVVISGFGRVSTETDVIENPAENPRLYQFQIDILPENQTKTITSIDFTKLSPQEGAINIFALSGKPLGTCPAPSQLTVLNTTNFTADISWAEPVIAPANGYAYYLTPDGTPPANGATPDGYTGSTTIALTGLTMGQVYCFWLRSACSDTELGPLSEPVCFTPGQISSTHPNDIPTLFLATVDLNSTTSCPGVMTVNVPDGYVITSVATAYDMQTAANGWMSEQHTVLACNTTGLMETAIATGTGNTGGTFSYARSGLDIANGAMGTVEFELRAWRTYGGGDCNTDYNRVVAGTWTVTVTLSDVLQTQTFAQNGLALYPNPADDVIHIAADETISAVSVFNLLGQKILERDTQTKTIELNTTDWAAGRYLVKITSENGVQTRSVLIR